MPQSVSNQPARFDPALKRHQTNALSATQLLALTGISGADNLLALNTAHHWQSDLMAAALTTSFSNYSQLKACMAPWMPRSGWFTNPLDLAERYTKALLREQMAQASAKGQSPDALAEHNRQLEIRYAQVLASLTESCINSRGRFSPRQASELLSEPADYGQLVTSLISLGELERQYHSIGLTRLAAYKELLKAWLIATTASELPHPHPYRRYTPDGQPQTPFSDYLENLRSRFECLHQRHAFDPVIFSEQSSAAHTGATAYEVVPGSEQQGAQLRYFPASASTRKDSPMRVIYLSSPLINRPEIFDLAAGKSVVEGLLARGYAVYQVCYPHTGPEHAKQGLSVYGKIVHDRNLALIRQRHPGAELHVIGYCMGGTLILPYLARRAEERKAAGQSMDVTKVVLMATPVKFDDDESGHGPMRQMIRRWYRPALMDALFATSNIPPQMVEAGMQQIQPGVAYYVTHGFFERATTIDAIDDTAPFLNWLYHGTHFPAQAHREWIEKVFLGNQIWNGEYRLPSPVPSLNQQPVNMQALADAGVEIMDYRGERDPISPAGSCVASETWGCHPGAHSTTAKALNRTIEKNIGHIFVVSRRHLSEFLQQTQAFFETTDS